MNMNGSVHVFTERDQAATDYLDCNLEPPMRFTHSPRQRLWCWTCHRERWAKNMIVHVYYDSTRFFCREGHVWDGRRRRFVTKAAK